MIVQSVGWEKKLDVFEETPTSWKDLKITFRKPEPKEEKKDLILKTDKYGHNVFHILAIKKDANPAIIQYLKDELSRVDPNFRPTAKKLRQSNTPSSDSIFSKPDSHSKVVSEGISKKSNSKLTPSQLGAFKGNPHALDMLRLSNWKFGPNTSSLVQVDQLSIWDNGGTKRNKRWSHMSLLPSGSSSSVTSSQSQPTVSASRAAASNVTAGTTTTSTGPNTMDASASGTVSTTPNATPSTSPATTLNATPNTTPSATPGATRSTTPNTTESDDLPTAPPTQQTTGTSRAPGPSNSRSTPTSTAGAAQPTAAANPAEGALSTGANATPNAIASAAPPRAAAQSSSVPHQTQQTAGNSKSSTPSTAIPPPNATAGAARPAPTNGAQTTNGDSHKCDSPWSTLAALEIAVANEQADVIGHPLIQAILQIKWHLYARRKFLLSLVYTTFIVVLFTIALALQPANPYQRFSYTDDKHFTRAALEIFAAFWWAVNSIHIMFKLANAERRHVWHGRNDPKTLQARLATTWYRAFWRRTNQTFEYYIFPLFRVMFLAVFIYRAYLCALAGRVVEASGIQEGIVISPKNQSLLEGHVRAENVLLGSAAIFAWLGLLYYSKAFPELGPLYIAIRRAVLRDLRSWVLLFATVLFGFSSAFFLQKNGYHDLAGGDGVDGAALNLNQTDAAAGGSANATDFLPSYWDSWPESVLATFRTLFQQTDYERFSNSSVVPFAKTLDVIFTLFTLVLVLNILIAKLSQSFTTIASDSQKVWGVQFADLIVEIDLLLTDDERKLYSANIGHHDHTDDENHFITVIERASESPDSAATHRELLKVIVAFEQQSTNRELWTEPFSKQFDPQTTTNANAPQTTAPAAQAARRSGRPGPFSASAASGSATSISAAPASAASSSAAFSSDASSVPTSIVVTSDSGRSSGGGSKGQGVPIEIDLSRGLWYEWHYSLFPPELAAILYKSGRRPSGSHHEFDEKIDWWVSTKHSEVLSAVLKLMREVFGVLFELLKKWFSSWIKKQSLKTVNLWKTHYLRVEPTRSPKEPGTEDCYVLHKEY
ncbi:hypothetical protein DFJ73DRAFT_547406 [Zopfochytrium polystomum]|nr:hypothetical protein DFJ73DRAFT_547406 [Zopfochytrium polystomum]